MNWEAIGAVGEAIGAFGVILTLGYLALQIRQNTRSLKSASYQSAISSMSEVAGVMEDHLWNGMKNSMLGYYHLAMWRTSLPVTSDDHPGNDTNAM
jgi:hypothetical protein